MEIKHEEARFYIGAIAHPDAELTYRKDEDGDIIIDHTIVSEKLQGQGVAAKLVDQAVEFAREQKKQIVPQCSYALKKIEATPDYHDVWKGK
ncbi:GNAT family N-acetyltransferase [Thalassobacillus hwangdonensis]|uniref:GNAT family N-acetyltransferase n=1 Tax=Thalassobacillus hwangdonensis TaxID=546108 RepID=A0ABW3L0E1_9BACI